MELYAPYIPQAVALATWCTCMVLVTARKISTPVSSWLMLAGSGAMALACLASGSGHTALSCLMVSIWLQAIPLFALDSLREDARACATVIADGAHVALTMSMVAEATYSGAHVCSDAARLAGLLAGLSLLDVAFRGHVGPTLLGGRGAGTLVVATVATACVILRSTSCSFIVDIPGWRSANLTEAAIMCCAVALPACPALYAPPPDGDGTLAHAALPAAMVAESCCMTYLGDASTGIAFALSMATIAKSAGRRVSAVAVSLFAAVVAAIGLSLVVPNMANAWHIWSGTMTAPFADIDQARTAKVLFSGNSVLLGCGVGRWSQAMAEAPYGVVWPLMMAVGTFGTMGLATLVLVATCSIVTGTRTAMARDAGKSLPFLAITMGANLALGLLSALGTIPDLGNCGPMFFCIDATACKPIFLAMAMAIALGCDTHVSDVIGEEDVIALLPPGSEE